MAFSWFAVDSSVVDHPKVMALCAELGEPLALAYVIRLWSWTHRYAISGVIKQAILPQLERSISWNGAVGELISAFIKVGLIEQENGDYLVHDWWHHQGQLVEKSNKDADRMRKYRKKMSRERFANGNRTKTVRDATTLHNTTDTTQHDTTQQKGKQKSVVPPDPRHQETVSILTQTFARIRGTKYLFKPRDAKAITGMLSVAGPEEINNRLVRALNHVGWPGVNSFHELEDNFNAFTGAEPKKPGGSVIHNQQAWTDDDDFLVGLSGGKK